MATTRIIPKSEYYSGQGQVIIAERNAVTGKPEKAYAIGNAPTVEIAVSTTQVDHKESMSGQRAIDFTLLTEKSATINLTIESLSLKNLATSFYGDLTTVAEGTVVGEIHPMVSSADGGLLILGHNQVSDVTLTTGSAVPVPAGAYFLDAEFGTIQWNPEFTPAVTGPVTVGYDYEGSVRLDALTSVQPPERFLRFQGINTIDETLVLVEIPRAQFQPLQTLGLITEEVAQVQLTASILQDTLLNDGGSKFYRQTVIKPMTP